MGWVAAATFGRMLHAPPQPYELAVTYTGRRRFAAAIIRIGADSQQLTMLISGVGLRTFATGRPSEPRR